MIPWSRKLLAISFVSVALISGGLTAYNLAPRLGPAEPQQSQHWVLFSGPAVEGDPIRNATGNDWVVRIRAVSSLEPLSKYQVSLLRNGEVIVDRADIWNLSMYDVGDLFFNFVDSFCPYATCSPQVPERFLSEGDVIWLRNVDLGTTYVLRVIWAESGEVAGEVTIET